MILRKYKTIDCKILTELFYHTVHFINCKDYSKDQLDVWAVKEQNMDQWNERFNRDYTLVAEVKGIIVGFGNLATNYLDMLYVHKDYQQQGIATAIVEALEAYAVNHSETKIITHASITARGFFENRGYQLIKEQQVVRNGISLKNYRMEKIL